MKNVVAYIWEVFRIGMFGTFLCWVALVQGELPCVGMCSGGALLDHCFGGFCSLCTDGVEPFCLPCEESVRVLLSSDLVSVLCLAFDHLLSLWFFVVVFLSFFIW